MHQISQVENFDGIVRQYSPMVYGTCIRILNDPAKAEDATQETFIKFLESSSQIRKNVGAWLHRVAITQSLTHMRAEKRREKRQNAWAKWIWTSSRRISQLLLKPYMFKVTGRKLA